MLTWFCFINRTVLTNTRHVAVRKPGHAAILRKCTFSILQPCRHALKETRFQYVSVEHKKTHYNLAICFCQWTKMNTHWSFILVWREGYKVLTRTQIVFFGRKRSNVSLLSWFARQDVIYQYSLKNSWWNGLSLFHRPHVQGICFFVSSKYIMR